MVGESIGFRVTKIMNITTIKTPLISYVVLIKNEGKQLKSLFELLSKYMVNNECIILDDFSDDSDTNEILKELRTRESFSIYQHKLAGDYSEHRNSVFEFCKGEYIVSIDGDEIPSEFLLKNLPEIFKANTEIELYWVSRMNDFNGVYPSISKQYGWTLTPAESITREKMIDNASEEYKFLKENGYIMEETEIIKYKVPLVNWPDYQTRIFKNLPHIRWRGRLHERINGNRNYVFLPKEEDFAFYHNKTIKKQMETNLRYNKEFSKEDNLGLKCK